MGPMGPIGPHGAMVPHGPGLPGGGGGGKGDARDPMGALTRANVSAVSEAAAEAIGLSDEEPLAGPETPLSARSAR